jgi:hypothetical protein
MYVVGNVLGNQYDVTNVTHFSFNLLRIKSLYMFSHITCLSSGGATKRHLVYSVRMSVGCDTIAVSLTTCHTHLTIYVRSIPNAVCLAPPEDEQVMLETCKGP